MKGYIYTLESIVAISIILIAVVVILSSQRSPPPLSAAIVKQQGFDALEFLDRWDSLRQKVVSGDTIGIKNDVKNLLPFGILMDVLICDVRCDTLIATEKSVVAVDYYISTYRDSIVNKKVRLVMWGDFS